MTVSDVVGVPTGQQASPNNKEAAAVVAASCIIEVPRPLQVNQASFTPEKSVPPTSFVPTSNVETVQADHELGVEITKSAQFGNPSAVTVEAPVELSQN